VSEAFPSLVSTQGTQADSSAPDWSYLDLRGRHLGRYLVLGTVGRGGMGVVVEAHDEILDRSVAVKLLYPGALKRSERRLLREAQALARLSHPNVVQIYDIGELDGQTFIAMELVRGRTLRVWGREPHPWRVALSVYLQAARGLAAAHAKGLMHRDFKPENCIIDDEGRVRVLDFGLAREVAPSTLTAALDEALGLEDEPTAHALGEKLTRPGVLMGTLGYMSFEQLKGHPADAQSDQFSFCVSLYEAIYGVAPYGGESISSLFAAMLAGTRQPAPAGIVVPRRLSQALWRGMSKESAERWPSMDALIDELEALSSTRRSRAIVIGLGMGLVLTAGLAFMREAPDPCPDVATALAGTWDAEIRHGVEQSFTRHGPDDSTLLPRVVERLDGYANAWADMTTDSCRATFVVRRQSEAQLEQRTRCLERRRNQLVATVAVLADAEDADELNRAVVLPFRLPALDPCAEAMSDELDDVPTVALDDARPARIRREIDEASTLREAGRTAKATALAEAALAEARELGEPGLQAEALECLGRLQAESGSMSAARATLEEAIMTANSASDDPTAARAWMSLLFVTTMQGEHARAEGYALPARAAVARNDDDVLQAWLLNNLAILAADQDDFVEARERFEQALALKQATLGPDHVDVGIAWQNLGAMLTNAGQHQAAADALAHAQEIFAATLGESHPWNTLVLYNSCHAEQGLHRFNEALALCERALAHLTAGSSPLQEGRTLYTLAEITWDLGRHAEALTLARRALSLIERENPELAVQLTSWLATHEQIKENL